MPIRFLSHAHQPPPPIPNPKPHHLPTLAPFHSAIFRMQGRRPSSAPSPFGVAPHPPSRFLSKSIRTIFPKTAFPLSKLRKIALHPLFIGVRRFSGSNNWGRTSSAARNRPTTRFAFDCGCGPPRTSAPTDSLTFHSCAATNRIGRIHAGCSASMQSQTLDAVASHLSPRF